MTSRPEPPTSDEQWEYDPVFLNSRREAFIILFVWIAAFLWVVPFSYLNGFKLPEGGAVPTIWGIPQWTFWGIFIPWLSANAFTIWFAFCVMKDDPLEPANSPEDLEHAQQKEGA